MIDYRESCRDYFDKLHATVVSVEFIILLKLNGFICSVKLFGRNLPNPFLYAKNYIVSFLVCVFLYCHFENFVQ